MLSIVPTTLSEAQTRLRTESLAGTVRSDGRFGAAVNEHCTGAFPSGIPLTGFELRRSRCVRRRRNLEYAGSGRTVRSLAAADGCL